MPNILPFFLSFSHCLFHLEIFDRLTRLGINQQLIFAKTTLEQFLIGEFKGHLAVSSDSH